MPKRVFIALLLGARAQDSFTAFITPSVAPTKAPISPPIGSGGFRCMNRGSSPSYSWTNFDVRAVGGALTITIDDGNSGDPRFRDWCWNMDPENDEIVDIYYQRLGARALRGVDEVAPADAVGEASAARQAQAIGPWLNPFMVRVPAAYIPPSLSPLPFLSPTPLNILIPPLHTPPAVPCYPRRQHAAPCA